MTKKCNVAGSYRTVRRKFLCVLADFCVCYAPVEIHGPQITSPQYLSDFSISTHFLFTSTFSALALQDGDDNYRKCVGGHFHYLRSIGFYAGVQ